MNINYTAKREIISGHSASTAYDIDSNAQQLLLQQTPVARKHVALDGTTYGNFVRTDKVWQVTTAYISDANLDLWWEFFASVAAGESFTFDAFGTSASPDDPVTAYLESPPNHQRLAANVHFFTFSVRQA